MSPAIRGNDYAKGNDGGAPPGNSNAVGNSGGPGAPKGNARAAKHHGWSDTLKHYHRLTSDAKELVDQYLAEYVEDYALVHGMDIEAVEADEEVMNDLRRLAANHDQWMRTTGPIFEEGIVIEEECEYEHDDGTVETWTESKINPAENASHRLMNKRWKIRERLGIEIETVRKARERQEALAEIFENADDVDWSVLDTDTGGDTDATESAETPAHTPDTDPDPQTEPGTETTEHAEEPASTDETEDESANESEESTSPSVRLF